MQWTEKQILQHRKAAVLLKKIIDDAFIYIQKNSRCTEYNVQQFILGQFKKNNLLTDKDPPIVGFNANAAIPHYFPKKKTAKHLEKNTLVLIDVWARVKEDKSPFADITWMGYYGNIPKDIQNVFDIVVRARDKAIDFVKARAHSRSMPRGLDVDAIARGVITKTGFGRKFIHSTGHSLGFTSPHGIYGALRKSNKKQLHKLLGYTIEPGIYLKGKFGVRSEMNLYIDKKNQLIVTTVLQKKIVRI